MSDQSAIFKASLYMIFGGSFLAYQSYKKIKQKTQIKEMARQMISAASAGRVEIEGVAWPFRAIDTSLDNNKVVFRKVTIQKLVKRGKHSEWETIWQKHSLEPFLVFDQSGFLTVISDPHFSNPLMIEGLDEKIYLPTKLSPFQDESFHSFYDQSVSGFSTRSNGGFISAFFSMFSEYRILERHIGVGTPLLIHGYLTPDDSPRYIHISDEFAVFRTRVSRLLTSKAMRLQFFDKNKDGNVDEKELYNGFRNTLKASVKKELTHVDLKQSGLPTEKLYGTLASHSSQDLQLFNSFEEQTLAASPVYRNWLLLYLAVGTIGVGVFLILNQIAK